MMGLIYIATCRETGKMYVGQTRRDFRTRLYRHKQDKASDGPFQRALRKYGYWSFDYVTIDSVPDCFLDDWERFFISEFNTIAPHGYNLTSGGHSNGYMSPDTIRKMSEARKGSKNPNFGKPRSEDVRRKVSETKKSQHRKLTDDHRTKLRVAWRNHGGPNAGKVPVRIDGKIRWIPHPVGG